MTTSAPTSPAPTLDVDLLNKVLDLIDTDPSKWGQGSWISGTKPAAEEDCTTTACVSGWAMLLSEKWTPVLSHWTERFAGFQSVSDPDRSLVASVDSNYTFVNEGALLLGLDNRTAYELFMEMPYEGDSPHTFTDSVRVLVGLEPKWGTIVEVERNDANPHFTWHFTKAAEGESPEYADNLT